MSIIIIITVMFMEPKFRNKTHRGSSWVDVLIIAVGLLRTEQDMNLSSCSHFVYRLLPLVFVSLVSVTGF